MTVSSSGYVNYGTVYSCGGYSPSTSTVNAGQTFTQSRSCTQGTRNTYSFNIGGSHYKSSSKSVTTTRSATGTKVVASTWSSPPNQGTIQKNTNAPGSCFNASDAAGYPAGPEVSGTCTIGSTHKYSALTGYTGNNCQITKYLQTCS